MFPRGKVNVPALAFFNEPGDATRYEFLVLYTDSIYHIVDYVEGVRLPRKIKEWEVVPSVNNRVFSEELIALSEDYAINPNTMNQVMLAIERYNEEV